MTDVYVAYARQDRERLRVVGELLRQEGWDSWMDPAEPKPDLSPIADLKLGWSKAVLVLWSDSARRSEYVRSEAATGLYKNKLIQARIDSEPPPRPFDEMDAVDLSRWNGDPDDPNWRRLTAMLRNCAGDPVKPPTPAPKRAAAPTPPPLPLAPPPRKAEPERPAPPPIQFADPAAPRFAEPPPASRHVEAPPPPQPPPPPRYDPPPPPRFAESPPPPPRYEPPPAPRYEPPPSPRYAESDTTRYVDRSETTRGPRLAESVYRVPQERRDERLEEPDLGGRRASGFESGYFKQRRSFAALPVVAAVALIGSGVGLWLVDPFGWRVGGGASQEQIATGIPVQTVAEATTANAEPATGVFEDTDESAEDWRRVDRKDAEALRDHVSAFPRAGTAETARSTLRVMDAQAWVKAVTNDSEAAYRTYLAIFPAAGDVPGAMAKAAEERLAALGAERSQAIEEIQRGLASLQLYDGATTGKADEATAQAMRAFSQSSGKQAPALASATPRDLRAFADAVRNTGAQPKVSAAVSAAVEADRQRIAQAQAASAAAARAAVVVAREPGADSLAAAQQSRIAEEVEAWAIAERDGTLAGYRAYLAAYPGGARATNAEALIAKLSRPAPYSIDQLSGETKAAVEAARRAQATATQRASAARQTGQSADGLKDAQTITGADGDRYVAQISGGAPNGLGVRTRGGGPNAGDRYRGEMRNGQANGVGVYEFADNPGNAAARAARYEGEHTGDVASGHGVMHWKSGDSLAGSGAGGGAQARGVLTYANGQRYEGEMASGNRHGFGVVWAADGSVIQAGRWARGELVDPATR